MKSNQTPELTKKVTINLPIRLAEEAPAMLGKSSLTEAIRDALREALHRKGCEELRALRGKVNLDIDLAALRNDD